VARDGEPGPVPAVTADTFWSTLEEVTGPETLGALARRPLCVVDVDDRSDIGAPARFLPCVVVGVARERAPRSDPPGADILLTDDPAAPSPWVIRADLDSALDQLASACRAAPLAAVALAQLLRFSPRLEVPDALVAESFVYSMLQAGPEHRAWLAGRPRPGGSPAPEPDPVALDRRDDVLTIRLERPHVHNAYNAAMRDGLVAGLQLAVVDPTVRQVRITGSGPSFCSGGDLAEFGTASDPATAHAVRISRGAAIWMHRCSPRSSVRVHGACIGAGLELAGFAGRVVADPTTRFRLPEVAMGLVPGAGGTVSLPRRIGRQRAAYLAISGEALAPPTALEWGLVDAIDVDGHGPPR
jgi:enoyl-CoA hydratase/carnithine racemase